MRPKKTILCVDDNEQILSVRTFLLETRGYRVIAAHTPQEALEFSSAPLPARSISSSAISLCPRWTATSSSAAPSSFIPAFPR